MKTASWFCVVVKFVQNRGLGRCRISSSCLVTRQYSSIDCACMIPAAALHLQKSTTRCWETRGMWIPCTCIMRNLPSDQRTSGKACCCWNAAICGGHCWRIASPLGWKNGQLFVVSFEICLLSMWILHYSTLLVPFSIASKYRLENDTYLGT